MLGHLTIQNIVLIKSLSLQMQSGLTALTGETGAGKSILLDSLGLALGQRAESGMVRKGADQGSVTAVFSMPDNAAIRTMLNDQGIAVEDDLILRRVLTADGRSKAFVNDNPVSVSLLREIGDHLVDIHGQFETHGLMDPKTHLRVLDQFGVLDGDVAQLRAAYQAHRKAVRDLADHEQRLEAAKRDEEYLTACVDELEKVAPEQGEEEILLEKRQILQHREHILKALNESYIGLEGEDGANDRIYQSFRSLERIADKAGEVIDPVITALDQALSNLRDIAADIEVMAANWDVADESLESVDDRIHLLRGLARKHQCLCDDLPDLLTEMQDKLSAIHNDDRAGGALRQAVEDTRKTYNALAQALSDKRKMHAEKLAAAVMAELPDLKLGGAVFRVAVDATEPHENGIDDVKFMIRTNAGSPEGALNKIASGGELSRIMLALKVVLSETDPVPVMVFDEVDSGIGGATADAVGQRLARLSKQCQILVVTHSPQVAARADHHWIVSKSDTADGMTETSVGAITEESDRVDEIARMVSGASVTDEARAAAKVLRNAA